MASVATIIDCIIASYSSAYNRGNTKAQNHVPVVVFCSLFLRLLDHWRFFLLLRLKTSIHLAAKANPQIVIGRASGMATSLPNTVKVQLRSVVTLAKCTQLGGKVYPLA